MSESQIVGSATSPRKSGASGPTAIESGITWITASPCMEDATDYTKARA